MSAWPLEMLVYLEGGDTKCKDSWFEFACLGVKEAGDCDEEFDDHPCRKTCNMCKGEDTMFKYNIP